MVRKIWDKTIPRKEIKKTNKQINETKHQLQNPRK